jgi:hypothetical protein
MKLNVTWRRQLRLSWKKRDRPAPDIELPYTRTASSSQAAKRRTIQSQVTVAACFSRTLRYIHTHVGTKATFEPKDPRIVYTKRPRTNVYVGCHPHDLVVAKETMKVLPRNTTRQNIFNRQTWQEFYLCNVYAGSQRPRLRYRVVGLNKASIVPVDDSRSAAAMLVLGIGATASLRR